MISTHQDFTAYSKQYKGKREATDISTSFYQQSRKARK
jgi:hypothetical protein